MSVTCLPLGNYTWDNDIVVEYSLEDLSVSSEETELFVEELIKVGNILKKSAALISAIKPVDRASINSALKTFVDHYA